MPRLGALSSNTEIATVVDNANTSFTLALTDAGDYIRCTASSAVTITVPLQSSVAWLADTEIYIEQNGTGQVTIAGASGVTINSSQTLKTASRYSVIALKRVASNVWTLLGDRQAA
jgi:hypothetical protein